MQENDKIQHTFLKNSKLEIDGNLLNRIKVSTKNLQQNSYLMVKYWKFSLGLWTRKGYLLLLLFKILILWNKKKKKKNKTLLFADDIIMHVGSLNESIDKLGD